MANSNSNKHIFPLLPSAQLSSGRLKDTADNRSGWFEAQTGVWSNVLYYARESRWNTKRCRRLHPSPTNAFIRRRQDTQSNELVISICDAGLKVWWICIPLFLNVHMLCWKGQWEDFFPPFLHCNPPHCWYNSYHSYLLLLLHRYLELYFLGLARSFSTVSAPNASQPNSFLLSQHRRAPACLWGLVSDCGLAAPGWLS